MATTKVGLEPCSGMTAEDHRKTFLIGSASLRVANVLDPSRPATDHLVEIRAITAPLLNGMEKSARQQQQQKKKKEAISLSEAYARRCKARNSPAAMFLMTGWLYFMMLLLTPMYLLMICYLTPQIVQPIQLVPIGEYTGNGIFIINNNGTLQWQLVDELFSLAANPPDSCKMECPCAAPKDKMSPPQTVMKNPTVTVAALPKDHERERRALPRGRVGRDLFQTLRGSYEEAKTKYLNIQHEVMSRASEVGELYNRGAQHLSGRMTRSVRQVRRGELVPGDYLMFRITRSVTEDTEEGAENRTRIAAVTFTSMGKKKPEVAEERSNELGPGVTTPSKRDAEEKEESGTDKRSAKFNDVGSDVAFEPVISDGKMDASVANRANEKSSDLAEKSVPQTVSGGEADHPEDPTANEVSEEKTDGTIYKPDGALKVTMFPTVSMEGKETNIKGETDKKCNTSGENVEGNEIMKESVLRDNMEPAVPKKGVVGIEEQDETTVKDEKELAEEAASDNLAVDEKKAGEMAEEGKALSEETGTGEEDKSPDPGEKELTPHPEGESEAAETGDSDTTAGISNTDAKEEK